MAPSYFCKNFDGFLTPCPTNGTSTSNVIREALDRTVRAVHNRLPTSGHGYGHSQDSHVSPTDNNMVKDQVFVSQSQNQHDECTAFKYHTSTLVVTTMSVFAVIFILLVCMCCAKQAMKFARKTPAGRVADHFYHNEPRPNAPPQEGLRRL